MKISKNFVFSFNFRMKNKIMKKSDGFHSSPIAMKRVPMETSKSVCLCRTKASHTTRHRGYACRVGNK